MDGEDGGVTLREMSDEKHKTCGGMLPPLRLPLDLPRMSLQLQDAATFSNAKIFSQMKR